MKPFIIVAGLTLLCAPEIFAATTPVRSASAPLQVRAPAPRQSLLARVTVYWAGGGSGSDRWTRKHQAATGVRLRVGHCAVDPRRIPYGSHVNFPDGTLLAVDTGRHVVSRKAARLSGRTLNERNALVIDRFFETKRQALAWADTHPHFMNVQVVAPGSRPAPAVVQRAVFVNPPRPRLVAYVPPRSREIARVSTLP